jgi:hypothetical protein
MLTLVFLLDMSDSSLYSTVTVTATYTTCAYTAAAISFLCLMCNRCAGLHVLRQKHWPGNAMMHPPNPANFASAVALRYVRATHSYTLVVVCYYELRLRV